MCDLNELAKSEGKMASHGNNSEGSPKGGATEAEENACPVSPSSITKLNTDTKEMAVSDAAPLTSEERTIQALATQLEYYFSSKNLSTDSFLANKMASNGGYAPITLIAGFNHVVKIMLLCVENQHLQLNLRKDDSLRFRCEWVYRAAMSSLNIDILPLEAEDQSANEADVFRWGLGPKGSVDGVTPSKSIKSVSDFIVVSSMASRKSNEPMFKERNTILFREVHDCVVEADLRQLVQAASGNVAEYIALVKKDVGKCWYVHFDDKYRGKGELAECLLKLRTLSLRDEPIKARLKTERIYLDEAGKPHTPHPAVSKDSKARRHDRYQNSKLHLNKDGQQRSRKPLNKRPPAVDAKPLSSSGAPLLDMSHSHFPTLGNFHTVDAVSAIPTTGESTSMKSTPSTAVVMVNSSPPSSDYAAALLKPSCELDKPGVQQKVKPKRTVLTSKGSHITGSVSRGPITSHDYADLDSIASSTDNGKMIEATASSTVSVSSNGSSIAPPSNATCWGKKSFAAVLKV